VPGDGEPNAVGPPGDLRIYPRSADPAEEASPGGNQVDGAHGAGEEGIAGLLDRCRNAEVAGDVVPRSARDYPQRSPVPREAVDDLVEAAVPSTDYGYKTGIVLLLQGAGKLGQVPGTLGAAAVKRNPLSSKITGDSRKAPSGSSPAGSGVDKKLQCVPVQKTHASFSMIAERGSCH
jgi:hypothetical protein